MLKWRHAKNTLVTSEELLKDKPDKNGFTSRTGQKRCLTNLMGL